MYTVDIKSVRQRLGLTQEKLAELADMSQAELSRIERGITSPTVRRLCRLAQALRVHPAELLRDTQATR